MVDGLMIELKEGMGGSGSRGGSPESHLLAENSSSSQTHLLVIIHHCIHAIFAKFGICTDIVILDYP